MPPPATRTRALMLATALLAAPAAAAPGPGLGNIDCTEAEKFKLLAVDSARARTPD
jgi:hypothetical protein